MPIRKRGPSWQVDVRLVDGSRIRRTYPTEEIAREAEKALQPNPQQRQMARFQRHKPRKPSVAIDPCAKPLCSLPELWHLPHSPSRTPASADAAVCATKGTAKRSGQAIAVVVMDGATANRGMLIAL